MAAMKKSAASLTSKAKAATPTTTQSATKKRSGNARITTIVTRFASNHARLFNSIRKWLQKRLPTAQELVYEYRDFLVISYAPNEHGYQGVLALRADEAAVKLYFNSGKDLPDPAKLLQGTGKQTRFLILQSAATLKGPEVATLIDQAIAQSPVPFPTTGPGAVVIRQTSASKRNS